MSLLTAEVRKSFISSSSYSGHALALPWSFATSKRPLEFNSTPSYFPWLLENVPSNPVP